jgi:hypothetical protein
MCETAFLERDWKKFDQYFRLLKATRPTFERKPIVENYLGADEADHQETRMFARGPWAKLRAKWFQWSK